MTDANTSRSFLDTVADPARVASISEHSEVGMQVQEAVQNMKTRFQKIQQLTDKERQEIEMRLLNADAETVQQTAARQEKDLGEALAELDGILGSFDSVWALISQPTEADLAEVREAETSLEHAKAALPGAEKSFRWGRAGRVAAANQAIADAKTAVTTAEANVESRKRARVRDASIDVGLQEFQARVTQVVRILKSRLGEISGQIDSASKGKEASFKEMETFSAALEKLDVAITTAEEELRRGEEQLEGLLVGSGERAAADRAVSDLRSKVEDLNGRRNAAFQVVTTKQSEVRRLETEEIALKRTLALRNIWILSFETATKGRIISFKSRLIAEKELSDQRLAAKYDELGSRQDQANMEFMVMVQEATGKIMREKVGRYPRELQAIMATQKAQVIAIKENHLAMRSAIEEYKHLYGEDPSGLLWTHEAKQAETAPETTEAAPEAPAPQILTVEDLLAGV